jgi:hypothetical protein
MDGLKLADGLSDLDTEDDGLLEPIVPTIWCMISLTVIIILLLLPSHAGVILSSGNSPTE